MPDPTNILNGLKISTYYKYVLYVTGVILVLSFFVPIQDYEIQRLRRVTIAFISVSLVLWYIDHVLETIATYYDEKFNDPYVNKYEVRNIAKSIIISH